MNIFSKVTIALKLIKPWRAGRVRSLTTSNQLNIRVAVCGASGGIGQPLSLMMKISPLISELALYDIQGVPGVAADLSHINTNCKVSHFNKSSLLAEALRNKDIIVVTAGKPRGDAKTTRADLFKFNAALIASIAETMSKTSPKAMLCIVTNPVNSLLSVAAGLLTKAKVYNPRKLFGVTTLDSVRASTFAAELMCYDPSALTIPIIGGHSAPTIVPVFSQSSSPIDVPKDTLKALVTRVQNGGTEVIEAKAGGGSATLSTAFATARFVFALCRAINGEQNVVECAMVQSDLTDAEFFATPLLLGRGGIEKNLGYGQLSAEECCLVDIAVKTLVKDIETGKSFLKSDSKEAKSKS